VFRGDLAKVPLDVTNQHMSMPSLCAPGIVVHLDPEALSDDVRTIIDADTVHDHATSLLPASITLAAWFLAAQ
jgi:hypothetical protein